MTNYRGFVLLLLYLIFGLPGLFEVLAEETPPVKDANDEDPLKFFSRCLLAAALGASFLGLIYVLAKGIDGPQWPEIPPFDPQTEGPGMRVKKAAELVRRYHYKD